MATGISPWSELRAKVYDRPGAAERIEQGKRRLPAEIQLAELRRVRHKTQVELAELLNIKQSSVSDFERRGDVSLSKLRKYVEALGGRLQILATFEDTENETITIPLGIT